MNITRADIYYPHSSEPWEDTRRKAEEHGYSYFAASQSRFGGTSLKLSSLFFETEAKGLKTVGALSEVPASGRPKSLNEVFRFRGSGYAGDCASTIDVKGSSCNVALEAGFEFVAHGNSLRRTEKNAMRRAHLDYVDELRLPEYNPSPYNPNPKFKTKEATMTTDLPISQQDVFHAPTAGARWTVAAGQAIAAGFRWVTIDKYWIVAVDNPDSSIRQADGKKYLHYTDLPEYPPVSFYDRVMQFVNDPERSDRNTLYLKLAQEGFFSNATLDDEPGQRRVIDKLLKSDTFCEYGKDKFRKHMGDLLDNPGKRVITISVTVPGDRDASEYEGRSVQSDIARYLGGVGSRGTGNFYREAEVLLVSDETIK